MRVETDRLILIAATVDLARVEFSDRHRFLELLGAEVPADWPPPLNDEASRAWVADYLSAHRDATGWVMWYFLRRRSGERPLAVGCGGFAGTPSDDGTCEVGYSVVESLQRNGYAVEATRALVEWAFSHPRVARVIAHTFPDLTPSIRVLEKCGFRLVGDGAEPGTIRYQLSRTPR